MIKNENKQKLHQFESYINSKISDKINLYFILYNEIKQDKRMLIKRVNI